MIFWKIKIYRAITYETEFLLDQKQNFLFDFLLLTKTFEFPKHRPNKDFKYLFWIQTLESFFFQNFKKFIRYLWTLDRPQYWVKVL